jgi:hypothetical protein
MFVRHRVLRRKDVEFNGELENATSAKESVVSEHRPLGETPAHLQASA